MPNSTTFTAATDASTRSPRILGTIVSIATALAFAAPAASAATYVAHDGASLAAALRQANAQGGPSTIDLTPGAYVPTATLTVDQEVTISGPAGPGLKIVGSAVLPTGSSLFVVGPHGRATFVNVTVTTAGGVGRHAAIDVAGAIDLENATVAGNAGPNLTVEPGATAMVRNSTLSDGLGAGLVDDGSVKVINATIAGNAGVGVDDSIGTVSLVNTIVAGNGHADCSAPASSTDHSLDGDGSCGVGALSRLDPALGPLLATNGGPTLTRALMPESPAIDAGDESQCPIQDQRHFARGDGRCDIGAYEAGARPDGGATGPNAGGGSGPKTPAGGGVGGSHAAGRGSVTGHGSLRGPHSPRITFAVSATAASARGVLTYRDRAGRVWLKARSIATAWIDVRRGTATITGSGIDLVQGRRVGFTALVTSHLGVRRVRLRLSTGYAGGGHLTSGVIAVSGAGV